MYFESCLLVSFGIFPSPRTYRERGLEIFPSDKAYIEEASLEVFEVPELIWGGRAQNFSLFSTYFFIFFYYFSHIPSYFPHIPSYLPYVSYKQEKKKKVVFISYSLHLSHSLPHIASYFLHIASYILQSARMYVGLQRWGRALGNSSFGPGSHDRKFFKSHGHFTVCNVIRRWEGRPRNFEFLCRVRKPRAKTRNMAKFRAFSSFEYSLLAKH